MNKVCKICDKKFNRQQDLSRHLKNYHDLTKEEYTIKYILKNDIPLCKCGCNQKVKVHDYSWNKYLKGHSGGGLWQDKYDKDSIEYKKIIEKISSSVSKATKGIPKSEQAKVNMSLAQQKSRSEKVEIYKKSIEKMTITKREQSLSGHLSRRHYSKHKSKTELDNIYNKISTNRKISDQKKRDYGIYPVAWNKGLTKKTSTLVRKYSGKNHYRWNPDYNSCYTELFKDKKYRKLILGQQNSCCAVCDNKIDLCLHHIDSNKKNDNIKNLVFLCRSCHTRLHNSIRHRNIYNRKIKQLKMKYKLKNKEIKR